MLRFRPAGGGPQHRHAVVFDGDERPGPAPIAPLLDALRGLGVDIDGDGLPFSVRGGGAVAGGTVEIDASGSSQFVSGLLLSGAAFTDGLAIVHTGESVPVGPARGDDEWRCCATRASASTTRRTTGGRSPRPNPRRGTG